MDNLLYLPGKYFPAINTQAYKVLRIQSDGLPHPKADLIKALDDDPRSALQALRGDSHLFWLIHNIGDSKGIYQLDGRHLSGNPQLDQEARLQAEIEYRQRSKAKSEQGANRLAQADIDLMEAIAKREQQASFDFFEALKKPAPVE